MQSSSAAKIVETYIDPDFRLKFVDEENYIEFGEWPPKETTGIVAKRGRGGEPYRRGGVGHSYLPTKEGETEQAERSEAHREIEVGQIERDPVAAQLAPTRRVNLEAMRSGREQIKTIRRKMQGEHAATTKLKLVRRPIDWAKLDQVGRPVVSFDPFNSERSRLVKIIQRDSRDRTRIEIVRKLGVEFSRIYERYRRDAERRKTKQSYSSYTVQGDREQKSCEEAAIQCVLRSVTPRQVLEYWDRKMSDYSNGEMVIPPLGFLKTASAIDRVATSSLGTVAKLSKLQGGTDIPKLKPHNRNTFSGTDGLDIRLRGTLEAAGFATQAYNDRYLLSIQHNALAIAKGKSIFLAEGRMRKMVIHVSKALYIEGAPDADT